MDEVTNPDDPDGFPATPCKPHAPPAGSEDEAKAVEEAMGEEKEKRNDAQKDPCLFCLGPRPLVRNLILRRKPEA